MKEKRGLVRWLIIFVTLSVGDLSLTAILLQGSHGRMYEGNPIAAEWLSRFGWPGLTMFKFLDIILVMGLCYFLGLHAPKVARRVATLGCCVLGAIMVYSSVLLLSQ